MPPERANTVETAARPPMDGRVRRGQDNRARIVAAMLELIRAGEVSPGAEAVAARADVGLRTVFRHFKDMDSLYSEMSQVIFGELRGVADTPFVAEDWKGRVLELVARRAFGFEKIAPFRRASDAQRHGSKFLDNDHVRFAAVLREILQREVPSEVAEDPLVFEALDLLLSFETWSRLRREQGLTPRRAREVLEGLVKRVIT
jgi:AcrR family transcriptional regulator